MTKTVSGFIIEQLAVWDVKYVFGLPGTSALGLVEAIRKSNRLQ
jgi:pyruvate oxidase/acetolactate synthase-1/2/3 large subunit